MSKDFAHLHVHTEYSLLDGFSRVKNLISRAKELNMSSVAKYPPFLFDSDHL